MVIAHRGTETAGLIELFTDVSKVVALLNDLCTDIKGPLLNKNVAQMNSASTFANKVVSVLQEIEQDKKVCFEFFSPVTH